METVEDLVELIALALSTEVVEETDEGWTLKSNRPNGNRLDLLTRAELDSLVAYMTSHKMVESPVALEGSHSYEILVTETRLSSFVRRRRAEDPFTLSDDETGLVYSYGAPSHALMCAALVALKDRLGSTQFLRRLRRSALPMGSFRLDETRDPWEWLHLKVFRRFGSVRVVSDQPRAAGKLRRYVDSALFQFAYNLDAPLTPVTNFASILPERASRHSPRARVEGIDCPRLIYEADLVHRYVAAVGSEDVVTQFLGFYQVAEHHFERLYNEAVVTQIRALLTAPSFSIRRDADISKLSKTVSRLVREHRDESGAPDEQAALELVLRRYVDLSRLKESLSEGDTGLVAWYATNEVAFSKGDAVNLDGSESDAIGALGRRIYKTRNSVVHAKLGERARYFPRRDDAVLAREIPLMRAVAEEVMVSTATVLE